MGVEIVAERRLLAEDEYEPVARSHYPAVGDSRTRSWCSSRVGCGRGSPGPATSCGRAAEPARAGPPQAVPHPNSRVSAAWPPRSRYSPGRCAA